MTLPLMYIIFKVNLKVVLLFWSAMVFKIKNIMRFTKHFIVKFLKLGLI